MSMPYILIRFSLRIHFPIGNKNKLEKSDMVDPRWRIQDGRFKMAKINYS